MSSYNVSGKYYNDLTSLVKGEELTWLEIELIKKIIEPPSTLLDIGAGTGRHLIPLSQLGYKVYGIEESDLMLSFFESGKIPFDQLFLVSFWNFNKKGNFNNNFNLITLFWNTLNELVFTKQDLKKFLKKCKKLLKPNGKILVNSDNPNNFDYKHLNYSASSVKEGKTITLFSSVKRFNPFRNITVTEELIEVKDINGKVIDKIRSNLKQRWWFKEEIIRISEKMGYKVKEHSIPLNNEMYLELCL